MSIPNIPLTKLEMVNDTLAEGIDAAGEKRELFLTKLAFYLGAHQVGEDKLKEAIELSLKDLSD